MKIGILTLPLKINYGGILQAYALQKILINLGHEVYIIDRDISLFRHYLGLIKRLFVKMVLKKDCDLYPLNPTQKQWDVITSQINRFIKQNFKNVTKKIRFSSQLKKEIKRLELDGIIIGSDQVWRPKYTPNLFDYYGNFIDGNEQTRLIAYAASFGVDTWEYNTFQKKRCKQLLKSFKSVSVREDSGVILCEEFFELNAALTLDPTLLLESEDYLKLLPNNIALHDNVFAYILDMTAEKEKIIHQVTDLLSLEIVCINPNNLYSRLNKCKNINECIIPGIEQWLQSLISAKYIVTDSFHGCVFSIIFNKPFVVLGNSRRGLSRIHSLLKTFSLENRLIVLSEINILQNLLTEKINWDLVNSKKYCMQIESLKFLISNLTV